MALSWSWLMIVLVLLPNKLHSQSDTTVFDFTEFNRGDPSLILQGDASDIGVMSLTFPTPGIRNSVGRALYSQPIRLWDRAGRRQANFQTAFTGLIYAFRVPCGISFFIAPVNATIPMASTIEGNMGLYDNSSGISPVPLFAVELDLFADTWDPNYRHVGINLNSRKSVAVERWDSGKDGHERNNVEARITYDARQRLISVFVNRTTRFPNPDGDPPTIARVEHSFDLKTLLPEWVQIGFSASTISNSPPPSHYISSWSFISFMVPDDDIRQFE